jgi:hypothetical protein
LVTINLGDSPLVSYFLAWGKSLKQPLDIICMAGLLGLIGTFMLISRGVRWDLKMLSESWESADFWFTSAAHTGCCSGDKQISCTGTGVFLKKFLTCIDEMCTATGSSALKGESLPSSVSGMNSAVYSSMSGA